MKDEGNVAVELILAITLLVSLLLPGITATAEMLDAKRDVQSVAAVAARMWNSDATEAELKEFVSVDASKIFERPMSLQVICTFTCDYPGSGVRLQVSTQIELFKKFTITESEFLIQDEVG